LRNWFAKSVLACGTISLLVSTAAAQALKPAVALIDAADAQQWREWVTPLGWQVIVPGASDNAGGIDARVLAVAAAVHEAVGGGSVDAAHIYLVARGDASAALFYTISRLPDLFAAALAVGGSPEAALDTGRIFAIDFTNSPVLWVSSGAGDETLANKLKAAGMNLEWRSAAGLSASVPFQWLAAHARDPFPATVDCETNSPAFASCFWLQPVKFDVGERNDVLPMTRIAGGSGAALSLGNFTYQVDDPGPGLLVSQLPPKYEGPLKLGDRLVELDGKPIANATQFRQTMSQMTEEKRVVVMLQRGKRRLRVETAIVLPRREPAPTARVQGKYEAADRQILIVSRSVTELRVTIPEAWTGSGLFWNGLALEQIDKPGCLLLTIEKELLHAAPCP
jgi:hypothetical protein